MDTDTRWAAFTARLFAQNQFAIKLGLDSMNRALTLSSLDTLSHKVVLVAGTNGKGTIASSMASLLTASGLRVGLYTSPHLIDFTERFRVDGDTFPRQDVLEVGEHTLERFASPESSPCLTFFELTTLMAVSLFERAEVDVAIYEVGLGGRLDATNALSPDLCVLGAVGLDHQKYLGETLDEILDEKLGILREHVPLFVSGQEHPAIHRRITTLAHSPLYVYNRNIGLSSVFDQALYKEEIEEDALDRVWWYSQGARREVELSSWGHFDAPYQRRHIVTAIAAADYVSTRLFGRNADRFTEHVAASLERMQWPGRLHYIETERGEPGGGLSFLCDAAHNVDGMLALSEHMHRVAYTPQVVFFSALQDKDTSPMWRILLEHVPRSAEIWLIELDNPRAMDAATLEARFEHDHARRGEIRIGKIEDALRSCARRGEADVLVCGSIYLLGELFERLGIESSRLNVTSA